MKKWFIMLSAILVFGLAACGDDTSAPAEEDVEGEVDEEVEEVEGAEEEEAEELTADDVLERSLDAAEELESAEMTVDMNQTMEAPDEEASLTTQTTSEAQIIMDPLTMYQTGTITVDMGEESEEQEMEIYLSDNDVYMYDTMEESWIKMDAGLAQMDQLNQQDPVEQLEMMERFTDEMDMEETEDEYILKITGDGDELLEFTEEMASEFMDEELMQQMEQEGVDIFESMNIDNVYYEIYIDNETFDTNKLDMSMELAIEVEGESLHLTQASTTEYTGINTVDSIEIPEEVEEEAIDVMEELENMEELEEMEDMQ